MDGTVSPFQNLAPSPTITTIYYVSATNANACISTASVQVVVNPNPTVSATSNKTLVCKGQPTTLNASGAATYSWSNNQTQASITVTPAVNIAYMYAVTGTDANGCTGTASITIQGELCNSISSSVDSKNQLKIFPNPNHGLFQIEMPGNSAKRSVLIYNVSGALIKTIETSAGKLEIDLQKEANGIYFIHVFEGDQNISVSKIVKE
jgi:hypothetical protein